MRDREKDVPAESSEYAEPENVEQTLDDLGVVYGGWHPAPPDDDPLRSNKGS